MTVLPLFKGQETLITLTISTVITNESSLPILFQTVPNAPLEELASLERLAKIKGIAGQTYYFTASEDTNKLIILEF